jgi:hypothetical protein
VLVFAATEYLTVPHPEPLAPDVIVIHGGLLLVAVQAHPFFVITRTVPFPPLESNFSLSGNIE